MQIKKITSEVKVSQDGIQTMAKQSKCFTVALNNVTEEVEESHADPVHLSK
jgi:hypothetical protein